MAEKTIPQHLIQSKYWMPVFYIFQNNSKLKTVYNPNYFDFDEEIIKVAELKRKAQHWSSSEKVMLNLALHLNNENNKFNLSDLDLLDSYNLKIAFKALSIRFRD